MPVPRFTLCGWGWAVMSGLPSGAAVKAALTLSTARMSFEEVGDVALLDVRHRNQIVEPAGTLTETAEAVSVAVAVAEPLSVEKVRPLSVTQEEVELSTAEVAPTKY